MRIATRAILPDIYNKVKWQLRIRHAGGKTFSAKAALKALMLNVFGCIDFGQWKQPYDDVTPVSGDYVFSPGY